MPNFAVVNGHVISNVIVADSLEVAEAVTKQPCFEITPENNVGVGWVLEPDTTDLWIPPTNEESPYNYY